MKWQSKGQEFDEIAKKILSVKAVYLFGAQSSGRAMFDKYKNVVKIKGFIDNNPQKKGKEYLDLPVISLADVELQESEVIVISVQSWSLPDIVNQLEANGYKKDENFFIMQVFFPVLSLYKHGELCLPSLSILPTTLCNLNCKHCLNFSPYIKKHQTFSLDEIKSDIDLLFSKVDHIYLFHITGGEPFLYKELPALIRYLNESYGSKIGQFETTTNGTLLPSDELLQAMVECNVALVLDDYRNEIEKSRELFDVLIEKLNKSKVNYRAQRVDSWIDLQVFDTNNTAMSDEQLQDHFTNCDVMWSTYRHGKLYLCSYAAFASVAEIVETDEYLDLNNIAEDDRNVLLEFRLGYSEKGYTEFCKRCAGVRTTKKVTPAEQV